jgi:hypothetical protein
MIKNNRDWNWKIKRKEQTCTFSRKKRKKERKKLTFNGDKPPVNYHHTPH